ncbi:MAG: alpha/beta fold hydrolase [Minisyncoccia bacterium]
MKKFLFLISLTICFIATPACVYADTIVESVFSDRTWSPQDGVYTIRGIAQVQGATLTILPGTRVEYEDGAQLRVLSGGKIIAHGAVDNHIIFTKQQPSSESLEGEGASAEDIGFYFWAQSTEPPVVGEFSYVDFSGMHYGMMLNSYSTVTIDHGTFADISLYPLHSVTGTLIVTNTIFSSSPIAGFIQGGIFTHSDNTFATDIPGWHLSVHVLPEQTVAIDNTDGVYKLVSAQVARTATLSIGPGVSIYYGQGTDEGLFNVQGVLTITGTAENPVTIYGDGNCSAHYPVINYYRWWGYTPAPPPPAVTIEHTFFRNLCGGIYGTYGSLSITETVFENIATTAVSVENAGAVAVRNSEFKNGTTALSLVGTPAIISNNSFHGNTVGIVASSMPALDVSGNWWGSANGPTIATNSGGDGQAIMATHSDGLVYSPWLTADPFAEPVSEPAPLNLRDPVIIIPGITGTKLIKNYGDNLEVWPNFLLLAIDTIDEILNQLILLSSGVPDPARPMILGDIIRSAPGLDIFNGLIGQLEQEGYREGVDLFVLPYDWRLSNTTNAVVVKEKIEAVLLQSGKEKVDIIAHSMGGILSKAYISQYGKEKVDQLFFIGTPHLGAPKAFKTLMYGDNMGMKFIVNLLNPNRVKVISQNMPSIYELLPTRRYVDTLGYRYVEHGGYPDYIGINDFLVLHDKHGALLANADILHTTLDTFDMTGIQTYNFVGCGVGKTVTGIQIGKKTFFNDGYKVFYGTGDETVPLVSAIDGAVTGTYYVKEYSHAKLPSVLPLRTAIAQLLKGEHPVGISADNTTCNVSGTAIEIHSPVSLHIYDESGRHTGPMPDGSIEYGIDGVSYEVIDHEKFAFLPEGQTYRIVNQAEALGEYDLVISQINEVDEVGIERRFVDVPISSMNMAGEVVIQDDSTEYELRLDQEGDGIYETTLDSISRANAPRKSESLLSERLVEKAVAVEIPTAPQEGVFNNTQNKKDSALQKPAEVQGEFKMRGIKSSEQEQRIPKSNNAMIIGVAGLVLLFVIRKLIL